MNYLKFYESIEIDRIKQICDQYQISDYTINQDNTVDANNVWLSGDHLTEIPLQFRKTEDFNISSNKLKSLKGSPIECDNFDCFDNELVSLEFSPKIVNGYFDCHNNNKLTSLIGGPETVKGYYSFANNKILNFEGFPKNYTYTYDNTIGCFGNPVAEIIQLLPIPSREIIPKFVKYLIEFDVINGNEIDESRLNQAYYIVTGNILKNYKKKFKNYKIV